MALRNFAGGSAFAHLLGRSKTSAAKKKAEDDEDDDEKRDRRLKDDEDDDDKDSKKKSTAKKAQDDDEEMDEIDDTRKEREDEQDDPVQEPDEDPDSRKRSKAKAKSKKAAEGDDDEDDDAKKAFRRGLKAGALKERTRVDAIFSSKFASGRPVMAAQLACKTGLPAEEAIGVLAASPKELDDEAPTERRGSGVQGRMASVPRYDVGQEDEPPAKPHGAAALASAIVAADQKRRGLS